MPRLGLGIGIDLGSRPLFTAPAFVGLLDLYPNAAVAYSLRKLRAAYAGAAVRIRRSGDNSEFDFGFDALGNFDSAAAQAFCIAGGGTQNGFVVTWYDQSGNGNNATETSANLQPLIISGGAVINVNLKPSIYSTVDATFKGLFLTTPLTLSNFTIFYVAQKDTNSVLQSVLLGRNTGGHFAGDNPDGIGLPGLAANGTPIISTSRSNTTTSSGQALNQHLSYMNRRNGTQAVGQLNNSNNNYNNAVPSDSFIINSIAKYFGGYDYVGKYQEIIIYANDQSSNRTGISNNINSYYAIY